MTVRAVPAPRPAGWMCRVMRRGPDPLLRGALVVALLTAAAVALQARQGLDWDALTDPVRVEWARVLAGSVLLLVLASLARSLLRRLRPRRRRPPGDGDRTEPEAEPFPFLLKVLAALVVLAALGAVWFVVDAVSGSAPAVQPTPPSPDGGSGEPGAGLPQSLPWASLLLAAAVLLAVAAAGRLLAARRAGADQEAEPEAVGPDAAQLSAAVEAAESHLAAHDDVREAIAAAYAAMAASIGAGLARRGRSARASDTPTELLERAVSAGLVDGDAAASLTALFREARFSRHPMGHAQRRAAEQALAAVRDELAARRA